MPRGVHDRRTPLDARTKAAAVRRYLAGDSVTVICEQLGISRTSVRNAVLAAGHEMRQPGASPLKTASGICVHCDSPFRYQYRSGRRSVCDACLDAQRPAGKHESRPCPECGKPMTRAMTAARCLDCHRKRQRELRRETKHGQPTERVATCNSCGRDFRYPKPPGRGGMRRICDECQHERKRTWADARRAPLTRAYGLRERECVVCHRSFTPTNSAHHFCSRACSATAARRRRQSGQTQPLRTIKCPQCGKSFDQGNGKQKFCTDACRYQAFKAGKYIATAYGFTYGGVAVSVNAARVSQMKRDFGLDPAQYEVMWKRQRGKCAVCRTPMTDKPHPHIDHDPRTMRVRGLLCVSCNMALGYLKDDPLVIDRAAAYLRDSRNKGRSDGRQHDER